VPKYGKHPISDRGD